MPGRSSVGIEVEVQPKSSRGQVEEREPFRIAVFGDFSGRESHGSASEAGRTQPIEIDRDNFDQVLSRLAPKIECTLADGAPAMPISFSSLDDFHPDSLFQRLPLFGKLRDLRRKLEDPTTFREALTETSAPAPESRPNVSAMAAGNLLDQMLEERSTPGTTKRPARPGDLQAFIHQVVAGSLVPGKDPKQDEMVARTDAALAEQMRALLHHPHFQAIEAAWRSVFFLVRRLETGVDLQVYLFDTTKQELRDDLNRAANLRDTEFWREVISSQSNGDPWSLLVGNYEFGPAPEDVELLARIAMVASSARAPFLAAAAPALVACDSLTGMPDPRDWHADPADSEFWRAVRELPESTSVGLLLPRFLLRLPYGKDTSPTEEIPFEEWEGTPVHHEYLWGNPAIAAACLLGQSYAADGWAMRPDAQRELSGLPLHVYKSDGESQAQPCAEAWLNDRAVEAILQQGIMPLVSARNSDRVLISRFQSVADPPKALAGRW